MTNSRDYVTPKGVQRRAALIRTRRLDPAEAAEMAADWQAGDHYVIDPIDGCHVWRRFTSQGYGRIGRTWRGRRFAFMAHRVAFVAAMGRDVRPGYTIDHACGNRGCVRASHLREMTQRDNLMVGGGYSAPRRRSERGEQ